VRVTLFVSGCTRHCRDCFNRGNLELYITESRSRTETEQELLRRARRRATSTGLTLLGGEPMEPAKISARSCSFLLQRVRAAVSAKRTSGAIPGPRWKRICCRTAGRNGCEVTDERASRLIDVLVDGAFVTEALKEPHGCAFAGRRISG
jgi:anaerobic ribonucleoside-triphosphate reductase activating protein